MKIFISHSSEDAELVKAFIDILRKAFNLPTSEIRCTSVSGYKLPIGQQTNEALRDEVNNSDIFIGFITENALHSIYTIFEFGARWGSQKLFLPIVCAKEGIKILEGPLKDINAANGNDQASIFSFLEEIKKHIGAHMENVSSYLKDIDSFVAMIKNSQRSNIESDEISQGEKSQDFSLSKSNIEVDCSSHQTIDIIGIDAFACIIETSDSDIAYACAKDGKIDIHGRLVGKTTLKVTYKNETKECAIIVVPMSNFCGFPLLDFSLTQESFENKYKDKLKKCNGFYAIQDGEKYHGYSFKNGVLSSVCTFVSTENMSYGEVLSEAQVSMNERYKLLFCNSDVRWYQHKNGFYAVSFDIYQKDGGWLFIYSFNKDNIKQNIKNWKESIRN